IRLTMDSHIDYDLFVYSGDQSSAGPLIAQSTYGRGRPDECTLTRSGYIWIRVFNYSSSGSGNYSLGIELSLTISQITLPNDNISFTTQPGENRIRCLADIKPDYLDAAYNSQIEWEIDDDPRDNYQSGNPADPERGNDVNLTITAPAAPNGRRFPLSYRIRAFVTANNLRATSTPRYVTQDERDQCRQEYIDMNKARRPARNEFVNGGGSPNFSFNELNSSINPTTGNRYSWAVLRPILYTGLEATRANYGYPMIVNSGYRNPIRQLQVNPTAPESRHIYGDAADIAVVDINNNGIIEPDEWDELADAATAANADYIEPRQQTGAWVHMDWRFH
ncbi:MAG: D-Ala-D-Ala carboxypeptidase family metallohydrolase, partial [bacterium]